MDPMTIALIVLVIAGIWAVVELALTFRQTRKSVSELTDSVNDTIGEVRPAIAKLDGAIDELGPAAKQVTPILEKASTTVDLINVDLVRVEGILSDVNAVTGAGAHVTDAVSGAANSVANGVASVAAKVAGKVGGKSAKIAAPEATAHLEAPKDEEGAAAPAPEAEVTVEQVKGDVGYFTYPSADDAASAAPAEPAPAEPEAAAAPATDGSAE